MDNYPILPEHIKTDDHFWDAFGNNETEVSAYYLVRLAQKNGDWRNFTKEEIDAFSENNYYFNQLTDDGSHNPPIKTNDDGSYSFTHKFVAKCFLSSPAVDAVVVI